MPFVYDEEEKARILGELFDWMADGKGVKPFCEHTGHARRTISRWIREPEWREPYRAAREQLGEIQAEQLVEWADKAMECKDNVSVQALKLKIDTYKWVAGRHYARVYGDRVDVTSDGEKVQVGVMALPAETTSNPE